MRKKIFIIIGILLLITLSLIVIWKMNFNNNNQQDIFYEDKLNLKNKNIEQIDNSGIKVTDMKLSQRGKQVKVTTTIKNNSGSDIDTFFISIELFNKEGKRETIITSSSKALIKVNETYTLNNFYEVSSKEIEIKSAKVLSFIPNYSKMSSDTLNEIKVDENIVN